MDLDKLFNDINEIDRKKGIELKSMAVLGFIALESIYKDVRFLPSYIAEEKIQETLEKYFKNTQEIIDHAKK